MGDQAFDRIQSVSGLVMDVGAWLRTIGFGQYQSAFRNHEIDDEVLHELTDNDLEKLGLPLGHRKRLLKAIAALGGQSDAGLPATNASAERRQITVLFCDLVGSTELATGLDPEDLRGIVAAYHGLCKTLVERHGGFVAEYLGDGVLVYFGYPVAHEDDAERAVNASLALAAEVPKLKTMAVAPLRVRIGIATGLVVVGDVIGEGDVRKRGAVGDTLNLAARLQGVAGPGEIVIADTTRDLIGELFELEALGPQELKGVYGATQAYAVSRARRVASRFEAFHATGPTALVGREEESERLLRCWSRAKDGEGQHVLLSGEAGIGKSRLAAALMERIAGEPHLRQRYFCSPQHSDSAFYPIIGQLERAAGFSVGDDAAAKLVKLHAMLARTSACPEDSLLLADLLSLSKEDQDPVAEQDPKLRRRKTLEALQRQFLSAADESPVLLIFEDAHWADPSSLEVLGQVIKRLGSLRVLLLITFRPEFEPERLTDASNAVLSLKGLSERETFSLIRRTSDKASLTKEVIDAIAARADGVPLFVEEVTKAIVEARAGMSGAILDSMTVPASLQASLLARLDRLGRAKELAQIGAAMGREFPYSLMRSVAPFDQAELDLGLNRLCESQILFRSGSGSEATFLFKHALLQDAAHGMMLREVRRRIHGRIADAMLAASSDALGGKPESVAPHLSEAGRHEEAALHWGATGLRYVAQSAYIEAIASLSKAISELALTPPSPRRRSEELRFQIALASTLFYVHGYTSSESMAAFEKARQMIEQVDALGEQIGLETSLQRYALMYGIWTSLFVAGRSAEFEAKAIQFLALAEQQPHLGPMLMAHRVMGATCAVRGDLVPARVHLDKVVDIYDQGEHAALGVGHDVGAAGHIYRAYVLYRMGHVESAAADVDAAVEIGRSLRQVGTLIYSLFCGALVKVNSGGTASAGELVAEALELAEKHDLPYWKVTLRLSHGEYLAGIGDFDQAIVELRAGVEGMCRAGTLHLSPQGLMWLARAYSGLGRHVEAQESIKAALTRVEDLNERWDEAEIRRTAGELSLLWGDPTAAARSMFLESLTVAHKQGARLFGKRSLASLAKLPLTDHGDDVTDVLTRVSHWLAEGL